MTVSKSLLPLVHLTKNLAHLALLKISLILQEILHLTALVTSTFQILAMTASRYSIPLELSSQCLVGVF